MLCLNKFKSAAPSGECVIAGWHDLAKQKARLYLLNVGFGPTADAFEQIG
jgi:hypothetical protein